MNGNRTAEKLAAMKTTELRKLASTMGIRKMSSARKEQLIPAIVAKEEELQKIEALAAKLEEDERQAEAEAAAKEIRDGADEQKAVRTSKGKKSAPAAKPNAEISAKALRFEADAKAAGWTALARLAEGVSLVTATAEDGRTLELRWKGAVCVDGANFLKRADGKRVKVRNASAARKILAGE